MCGHYGCGGVRAVIKKRKLGLVNNWLRHLVDVNEKFAPLLDTLKNDDERAHRLCELNVAEQVRNVCQSTVVQTAWKAKQKLTIHGWVYGLRDGLLRDLLPTPVTCPSRKACCSTGQLCFSVAICLLTEFSC